jgi:SAM-dependent methyltransferase
MTASSRLLAHDDIKTDSLDQWVARLKLSVAQPVQDGLAFPGFPSADIQRQFVGSAYEDALAEAAGFYNFAQEGMTRRAYQASAGGGYLDFGCGWGRIGRFFLRDFRAEQMAGVDIDPDMVAFCQGASLPGRFETIANGQPLPFADGQFRLITAYSVFTHLPPHLFKAWLSELMRVLAPGGLLVFTVEPPRFLDFLESADPASDNAWLAALSAHKGRIPGLREDLARDGVAYLPSGGGAYRDVDVYGDTTVTPAFLAREAAARGGDLITFIDDSSRFWQAAAVIRRRSVLRDLVSRVARKLSGRAYRP